MNDSPPASPPCAQCGKPMPAGLGGVSCPKCLLTGQDALSGITLTETGSLSDNAVVKAFGVAMNAGKPGQWQPPEPDELREMLPGYGIEKLIGRGGMGAVYRGVQTTLDRRVAIKILPPGLGEHDPAFVERFLNEARLMAKLAHPNVVTIYDSGETKNGQLYYVMELMDGTDVARMIFEQGRLSVELARAICLRVCDALSAAHDLGIVHRDIKPANVLVSTKNVVKVADFGLARLEDAHSGLTRTGFMVGTPDFLAPEAMTPGVELDGRADLYAVGVMLYQMLTGALPRGAFKPASALVAGLERHFDSVISRAMQPKPADRYASAAQMRHDLEQLSVVQNFRESADTTMAVPVGRLTAENIAQRPVPKISSVSPKSGSQALPAVKAPTKAKKKSKLSEAKIRWSVTLLVIVLCAAAGYVALFRVGQGVVTLSYDLPFLVHRPAGAGEVCMVYLDEKVGEMLDRKVQPALLDKLAASGARAVVYDLIFESNSAEPALDVAFAESMKKFRAGGGVVMLAAGREATQQAGVAMERLIVPNDTLLDAADDYGIVALVHDDRYTVRELIAGTLDEASLTWKTAQKLGAPLDEAKRLVDRWINYTGPHDTIPSVSVKNVLDGVEAAFFRGKIVVIGGKPGIVSPKLGEDLFSTPFHRLDRRGNVPLMSGVEVQANMLVNLLRGNWLVRSSNTADLFLVLGVALVAGWAFSRLRPFTGFLLAFAGVVLLSLAGVLAMHFANAWFPWSVAALVQLPVALVAGTGAHFYIERHFRVKLDAEQMRLREAFSKYLSPRMLERFTDEDFQLDPGGDKTHAAMMFTDIENFTNICQRVRDPMHIVEHLNGYFQRTTECVFNHDGGVIKYIGDAIFAAWGVPFADEHAAVKSVRAAWELHENAGLKIGGESLRTRVGLHYGEVVAGNIGSTKHIDYTLIGDAVNLASRIEGLNKSLGTSILLSDAVQMQVGDEFCTRRVGQFRVKGRVDVTVIHELLGPSRTTEFPEWARCYEAALGAFEVGHLAQAKDLFEQANSLRLDSQGDGPSKFFLEHLAKGHDSAAGVVDLREK